MSDSRKGPYHTTVSWFLKERGLGGNAVWNPNAWGWGLSSEFSEGEDGESLT